MTVRGSLAPLERVCVFAGASPGGEPGLVRAAAEFGRLAATCGVGIVYGGGHTGLMGALADGALGAGGHVTGVIPASLVERELAHAGLSEQHVVATMHERKALMASLSQAFVALPGGLGTLDELFEIWTWAQLGLHDKPIGLYDTGGFFQPLVALTERLTDAGFVKRRDLGLVLVESDPGRLLERLARRASTR